MKLKTHYTLLILLAALLASCTDILDDGGTTVVPDNDKGIGQLVLFSSGSAANTTSRANVIPYMEQDGRFVCKMYYHAKASDTDADEFDTETTPVASWLRVNDNEGNSVYWQNDYDMTGVDTEHQDYLDYGFDSRAQYFYWRNRLDHVFLGFTDYNKLKSNLYGTEQGKLFMYPEFDDTKKTKTGESILWPTDSYRKLVFRTTPTPNPNYSLAAKEEWENSHTDAEPYPEPETIDVLEFLGVETPKFYPGGMGYSYSLTATYSTSAMSEAQKRATMQNVLNLVDKAEHLPRDERNELMEDLQRTTFTEPIITADGTFRNREWIVSFDDEAADAYLPDNSALNVGSSYVVVFSTRERQQIEDIIAVAPANTFDLRRSNTMTSMTDQPDPLIALTKMKPTGATQEANRVRLYFKHQFSQIQVNLTNAENTAEIQPESIVSVELLGVSEKGYVFTNINPDGTQISPSYDPVIISKYTEEQIKDNPYGTSFNMFDMGAAKPLTSLKSFNAIAFGQLQAIRITWKEEDYVDPDTGETETGVYHVATYKITVDDRNNSLVNLRSGYRYIYDFELRRGTIAFIRAIVDGWQLDDDLDFKTIGTIDE